MPAIAWGRRIMNEAGIGDTDWRGPLATGRHNAIATRRRPGMVWAIATGFTLLAGACLFAGILAWREFQATDDVSQARRFRRTVSLIFSTMLDAESGQRGFLLTRDSAYLGAYRAAKAAYDGNLSDLRNREPTDRGRMAQAIVITRIGAEKFSELDSTIMLGRAGQFEDAIAVVRSGVGKSLMDELRRHVDMLTNRADDDITRTTAFELWLSHLLIAAIISALGCVAALAAILLYDAKRHFGLLATREADARQLAETLEAQVALRTRELFTINQRFNAALLAAGITVATQDRDLVFTWASRGAYGLSPEDIIGRPQNAVTPDGASGGVIDLKRGVIETGEAAYGEFRVSQEGAVIWFGLTVQPKIDEHGATVGIISCAIDVTRFKEQEVRIRLLLRELTHRSKNLLAVIQAVMRQTVSNSTSLADFETRFSARVQSLSGSHDLLVQEDWQGASLRDLARSQLGHYIDRTGSQIELSGAPLQIRPEAAQHIGMALHELATNAAKYGALSVPEGKIRVSWTVTSPPDGRLMCHMSWEESGGPPVAPPTRRGFGRVVIERIVARAVHGEVSIDYAPSGLHWSLVFPLVHRNDIC